MTRWLPRALARIRALAKARRVLFTLKARRELASLEPALDEEDARHVLAGLTVAESMGRRHSKSNGEWMYLFNVRFDFTVLYVKVILREDCLVISFPEDDGGSDE